MAVDVSISTRIEITCDDCYGESFVLEGDAPHAFAWMALSDGSASATDWGVNIGIRSEEFCRRGGNASRTTSRAPASRPCAAPTRVRCDRGGVVVSALTAEQRALIAAARSEARRSALARERITPVAPAGRISELCFDAARGDFLLALDLAVTAHETLRQAEPDAI